RTLAAPTGGRAGGGFFRPTVSWEDEHDDDIRSPFGPGDRGSGRGARPQGDRRATGAGEGRPRRHPRAGPPPPGRGPGAPAGRGRSETEPGKGEGAVRAAKAEELRLSYGGCEEAAVIEAERRAGLTPDERATLSRCRKRLEHAHDELRNTNVFDRPERAREN